MKNNYRILCDMDGVISNIMLDWLKFYNQDYLDKLTPNDITAWDTHKFVKPECGTNIYDYLAKKDFFKNCTPIDDAIEGINILLDIGYEVVFVTTPPATSQYAVRDKIDWIEKYFAPKLTAKDIIFTHKKHLIRGDFLIDDYENNLKDFVGYKILFNQPWNQHVTKYIRLNSWKDIVSFMKGYISWSQPK